MAKQKPSIKSLKEMNKEKIKEIKKPLTKKELLDQCRSALVVLKMKSKMGQLVQTHQIKQLKKEIARLLTVDKVIKNK